MRLGIDANLCTCANPFVGAMSMFHLLCTSTKMLKNWFSNGTKEHFCLNVLSIPTE